MALYDTTGRTYARTRRPDPAIESRIRATLCDSTTVANIGAGTGAYEPAATVVAVEPSAVMIAQRPPSAAPAVCAVAEALPLATKSVDIALAVLTIHHWTDLAAGVAEAARVARRRLVIVTWDPAAMSEFWLLRDYLPAAARTDRELGVGMKTLHGALSGHARAVTTSPLPVPADCTDGFGAAFWRRPEAYLDPQVRAGMSMLALTDPAAMQTGLAALADDVRSGRWHTRCADLLPRTELDVGYRLVVADL